VAEPARPSPAEDLRDLLVGLAAVYPAALYAGTVYWSDLATGAARYQADLLEGMLKAIRSPGQGDAILNDLRDSLKRFLETPGDSAQRAILGFNERFEAIRRKPPSAAAPGASPRGSQPPARGTP
jgi:hypothetical protein